MPHCAPGAEGQKQQRGPASWARGQGSPRSPGRRASALGLHRAPPAQPGAGMPPHRPAGSRRPHAPRLRPRSAQPKPAFRAGPAVPLTSPPGGARGRAQVPAAAAPPWRRRAGRPRRAEEPARRRERLPSSVRRAQHGRVGRSPQPGAGARSPGVRERLGPASAPSPPQGRLAPRPSWERRPARAGLRRAARDKPPRAAAETAEGAATDGLGRPASTGPRERPRAGGAGAPGGGGGDAPGRGSSPRGPGPPPLPPVSLAGVCGGLCPPRGPEVGGGRARRAPGEAARPRSGGGSRLVSAL